jgi:hypothetical protein
MKMNLTGFLLCSIKSYHARTECLTKTRVGGVDGRGCVDRVGGEGVVALTCEFYGAASYNYFLHRHMNTSYLMGK